MTTYLVSDRHLTYTERRNMLSLDILELRRLHFDLIRCYRIIFNIVKLEFAISLLLILLQ